MNIAVFSNTSWYIYNFRLNTIKALQNAGHNVIAIGPYDESVGKLIDEGIVHVPLHMAGSRINPLFELYTVFKLARCTKNNNVDLILSFTPKANIYASLIALPLRCYTIANVSGLGRLFIEPSFITNIAILAYRFSFLFSEHVFFQNEDDRDVFLKNCIVKKDKTSVLPGSGVDLKRFMPSNNRFSSAKKPDFTFLLIARMLWDKGIGEFVEAARKVKILNPETRFVLLGEQGSDNPASIDKDVIEQWVREGVVEFLDKKDDVRPYIDRSDCIVLPSYREGTPRSLLEASASGKPIITTDVPGCRNTVDHGATGFLCSVKDSDSLYVVMRRMLELSDEERIQFGIRGRQKMESEYDENIVIDSYFSAIEMVPKCRYKIRKKLLDNLSTT